MRRHCRTEIATPGLRFIRELLVKQRKKAGCNIDATEVYTEVTKYGDPVASCPSPTALSLGALKNVEAFGISSGSSHKPHKKKKKKTSVHINTSGTDMLERLCERGEPSLGKFEGMVKSDIYSQYADLLLGLLALEEQV